MSVLKNIRPYIGIARINHWIKNIFVLPGFVCGYYFSIVSQQQNYLEIFGNLLLALTATSLLASSNYVINEYLDRDFDRQHPIKKNRAGPNNLVKGRFVAIEYIFLVGIGLWLSSYLGIGFFVSALTLIFMGLLYNVPPIRTKDKPYIDVLTESINNPLRFLLGWFTIQHAFMAPSSILLSYWMGGAYLMSIKRYSELRQIADSDVAAKYRKSFGFYDSEKLLVSAVFYATLSTLFLGIFLIKYKIEYILCAPFIALLFAWYLQIGFKSDSATVSPEKLYTEYKFILYVIFLTAFMLLLFFIKIPALDIFIRPIAIQ